MHHPAAGIPHRQPTCSSVRPDNSWLSRLGTACTASSVDAGANSSWSAAEEKEVAAEPRDIDIEKSSLGLALPLWLLRGRGRGPLLRAASGVAGQACGGAPADASCPTLPCELPRRPVGPLAGGGGLAAQRVAMGAVAVVHVKGPHQETGLQGGRGDARVAHGGQKRVSGGTAANGGDCQAADCWLPWRPRGSQQLFSTHLEPAGCAPSR